MSERDDWEKSWQGERICVVCWKPRLGLNDEGVCDQCAREQDRNQQAIDWMSDQIKKMAKKGRPIS